MDDLSTSQEGINFITKWEGLKLKKYKCSAGKWTIGVGHVMLPHENIPDEITKDQAESLLRKDLIRFENAVKKYVTVNLNQNQFDALVSFIFNTGEGGLRNTSVQAAVNSQRWQEVPKYLQAWSKIRSNGRMVTNQGLLRRRISESELFLKPVQVAAPEPMVNWTKDILSKVQGVLSRLGLYTKSIDGLYGPGTESALLAFVKRENFGASSFSRSAISSNLLNKITDL